MYEVIIERPRGGAGRGRDWPRTAWHELARDDDGKKDGGPALLRMGPRSRSKWLRENLAPLRRFLVSRIGQPWSAVYSEICAHIAVRSAVQKHVLDHLRQYVELHPVMIDGWPHEPIASRYAGGGLRPLSNYGSSFYVCPDSGVLLLARRGRAKQAAIVHKLSARSELRQIDGTWFVITLADVPTDWKLREDCYDVFLKRRLNSYVMSYRDGLLLRTYGSANVYAVAKEQPRAQTIFFLLRQAERYAEQVAARQKRKTAKR